MFTRPAPAPEKRLTSPCESSRSEYRALWVSARHVMAVGTGSAASPTATLFGRSSGRQARRGSRRSIRSARWDLERVTRPPRRRAHRHHPLRCARALRRVRRHTGVLADARRIVEGDMLNRARGLCASGGRVVGGQRVVEVLALASEHTMSHPTRSAKAGTGEDFDAPARCGGASGRAMHSKMRGDRE
jgi:hypothetical protein